MRLIGKTSVVRTFLNEGGLPYIYVDARALSTYGYTKQGLYTILPEALTRLRGKFADVAEYLRKLGGVHAGPLGIELDWGERGFSIFSILNEYAEDRGTR